MESTWNVILPEILITVGGLLILCAGAFWPARPQKSLFSLALIFPAAAIAVFIAMSMNGLSLSGMLDSNGYARLFSILVLAVVFITVLFSFRYSRARDFGNDEYYALLLFSVLGMDLAARAAHWLILFLGLELMSLSLYILIAIRRDHALSGEAGLKYLISGAVGSAFLTFGIGLWYAGSGSLSVVMPFPAGAGSVDVRLITAAVAFIIVGIGFKISMVPFHLWTPDVYQGAPAPVTAFLSTGSKVAVFAFLIRFCFYMQDPLWSRVKTVIWIAALLTLVIGTITALSQSHLKRLLAYSSVAQMGYLIMTLLAVKLESGLFALAFYLIVYAAMDLGAFGIIAALSGEKTDRDSLEDYQGLGFTHPWSGAVLSICLISLAGLPPTAGFIGKVVLFKAVLQAKATVLAVIGIAMVVLSIYLYMKVVISLYMKPVIRTIPGISIDVYQTIGGGIILLSLLWLGIFPSPLLSLIAGIVH